MHVPKSWHDDYVEYGRVRKMIAAADTDHRDADFFPVEAIFVIAARDREKEPSVLVNAPLFTTHPELAPSPKVP